MEAVIRRKVRSSTRFPGSKGRLSVAKSERAWRLPGPLARGDDGVVASRGDIDRRGARAAQVLRVGPRRQLRQADDDQAKQTHRRAMVCTLSFVNGLFPTPDAAAPSCPVHNIA